MELNELIEAKRSKTEEFENLVSEAQEQGRELNEDESLKIEGLKEEVRKLQDQISEMEAEAERQEKEAEENAEREAKEEAKQEIEASLRALSMIDAEAELNKAYAELDRAWANYYEAAKEKEEAERKAELRELVKDILSEQSARNEQLKKEAEEVKRNQEEAEETERKLQEQSEAEEAERQRVENQEEAERLLKIETDKKMKNFLAESFRSTINSATPAEKISVRAAADGSTDVMGNVIPKGVSELDILGLEPVWKQMGVDYMPNATGTYTLPFQDPITGAKLAELAPVTGDTVTPSGNLISPKRYSVQKTFTVETLASASDAFINKILEDMVKGCDRAISKEIYTKALAGATEVAGATLTKDGFDALMAEAEIEFEGAFLANRSSFFDAKGVAIDAGSGRFLVERLSGDVIGKGATYEGVPFWYSNLFEDGVNQKYVVYGDISRIHVADYSMLEIISDKYTKAGEGKVIITVNKIADVALLNPAAFSKTPDLDAAA